MNTSLVTKWHGFERIQLDDSEPLTVRC
jgi:hypothetical protein